ncbi:SCAN domain-containing protein 3-like [Pecten maximus]|uniref:SCAN domain-containing protein 3-like n=1 Tax=Pecten maximus TaxID=6579 RepID=UPI00145818D5|nr:SCAN domain-containing protein 3-like [Pecten maximus]
MPSRQRRIQELSKSAKKCHNILSMFRGIDSAPNTDDESDADNTSRPASPFPDNTCPVSPLPNISRPTTPVPDDCRSLPNPASPFLPIDVVYHSHTLTESPAASPVRIPACKRRLDDTPDGTPPRKRHTSGHRLGFKSEWTVDRPWLINRTVCTDEEPYVVMLCRLCIKHQTSTSVWTVDGCRTIRLDKVKDHEKSSQHKTSLAKEDARSAGEAQATSVSTSTEKAVRDALKVLFYIVQNNLSLDLFSSMVDMCIDVGSPTLQHLRLAKNASYTSWDIVQELLSFLSEEVQRTVLTEIRQSPCYGLMVDEVCDVVSNKHMAMCCQYITPDGDVSSAFLCDPFIKDGKAATIVDTIQEEITSLTLDSQKMAGFASDGAAVFTGKHNGVAKRLKDISPGLITSHCRDHRLALACRDSFKEVKVANKVDETLERLHKYYKYSTVHTATLKEVQKAFGEPTLCVQQAKHHRWLSHSKAVTSVARSFKSLITDLEQNTISADAVGNGILKLEAGMEYRTF